MAQTEKANRKQVRHAGPKPELPWNVVLHNDRTPINLVVGRLQRIIPCMTFSKATKVTWQAGPRRSPTLRVERVLA